MAANPFAALLRNVPRVKMHIGGQHFMPDTQVLATLAAAVPADLAEAGKVLEGVTPGKWEPHHHDDYSELAVYHPEFTGLGHVYEAADANFIAWCREGVPALLARIAAMEARIKGLEKERDELVSQHAVMMMERDVAQYESGDLCHALAASEAKEAKLVEALDKARAQDRDPDCCYDEEWVYTMGWSEWHDLVDQADLTKPTPIYTLYKGPTKWVVQVPLDTDGDGEADDFETKMFDSEEAARAAITEAGQ